MDSQSRGGLNEEFKNLLKEAEVYVFNIPRQSGPITRQIGKVFSVLCSFVPLLIKFLIVLFIADYIFKLYRYPFDTLDFYDPFNIGPLPVFVSLLIYTALLALFSLFFITYPSDYHPLVVDDNLYSKFSDRLKEYSVKEFEFFDLMLSDYEEVIRSRFVTLYWSLGIIAAAVGYYAIEIPNIMGDVNAKEQNIRWFLRKGSRHVIYVGYIIVSFYGLVLIYRRKVIRMIKTMDLCIKEALAGEDD